MEAKYYLGLLAFVAFLVFIYKILVKAFDVDESSVKFSDLGLTGMEKQMFIRGYLFVTTWRIETLKEYADEMGVYFTRSEMIEIIRLIKIRFTDVTGITKQGIIDVMTEFQQEKARRVGVEFIPPHVNDFLLQMEIGSTEWDANNRFF